jgi:hypothetical protein
MRGEVGMGGWALACKAVRKMNLAEVAPPCHNRTVQADGHCGMGEEGVRARVTSELAAWGRRGQAARVDRTHQDVLGGEGVVCSSSWLAGQQ